MRIASLALLRVLVLFDPALRSESFTVRTSIRKPLYVSSLSSHSDADTADNPPSPSLTLFNSLSLRKEPFTPLSPPGVSLYTCGPTVYDHAHVGNFRAFLTYDILKRTLRYFRYDVKHVCNLTDVDDKIIARCARENVSLKALTSKYEGYFMEDLELLNVQKACVYPRATEHIGEMVEMIKQLEERGLAYRSDEGSWYFNVGAKEGYGQQLVCLEWDGMKSGASGAGGVRETDADEYDADKVGVRDFALWKAYKPDFDREDAVWETEIGKGRPGWHLECSAMAKKYLGESIDLHCGGIDLKFPHHENEIAQSEGASGKPFCACWLHNGFVNINDEKMSKSLNNFLTLRTACPTRDDIRAYRYLVVSSQYRNPLSFTSEALQASKRALRRMDAVRRDIANVLVGDEEGDDEGDMAGEVQRLVTDFETAIADDLSMPRAAASLFGLVKLAETEFKRVKNDPSLSLNTAGLRLIDAAFTQMDTVFGIFYEVPRYEGLEEDEEEEGEIPEEVMTLVKERLEAKEGKDWDLADSLRGRIKELGFSVKDVKGGDPIVTKI